MTPEPAENPAKEPEKVVKLDDFMSAEELMQRLQTTPEEFMRIARAQAGDYQTAMNLVQKLWQQNQRLRGGHCEASTIEDLVKENQRLQAELAEARQIATIDDLTGLYRRWVGLMQGEELLALAHRNHQPISLVMADVDDFGNYNNTYGHIQGDEALSTVARVMKQTKRDCDLAVRYGGEEFLLILPDTDQKGAVDFVDNLRRKISQTTIAVRDKETLKCRDGKHAYKTICAGVSTYDASARSTNGFTQLVGQADKALYDAKEYVDPSTGKRPKNRISIYQ